MIGTNLTQKTRTNWTKSLALFRTRSHLFIYYRIFCIWLKRTIRWTWSVNIVCRWLYLQKHITFQGTHVARIYKTTQIPYTYGTSLFDTHVAAVRLWGYVGSQVLRLTREMFWLEQIKYCECSLWSSKTDKYILIYIIHEIMYIY